MKSHCFKIGDHLSSPRKLYTHHGIYLGYNEVIHYSGFASEMSTGAIEITTLEKFCQGNGAKVIKHEDRRWNVQETIERAFGRLGEDWYNLLANNCEHFVNWCIEGSHRSPQVERAVGFTLSAIAYTAIKRRAPQLLSTLVTRYGLSTVASPVNSSIVTSIAASTIAPKLAPALTKAVTSSAISAGATTALGYGGTAAVAGVVGITAPVSVPVVLAVGAVVGVGTFLYNLWD